MRPAATQMKKSKSSAQVRGSAADLKSSIQAESVALANENHPATDFIIGALLFSLLSSNRCEAVNGLLPDDEQN